MAHNGAKHSLEIESRTDCLSNLTQCSQFPNRLREFLSSPLQFSEQAHVFNCDYRLSGERFEQLNMFVRERAHFGSTNIYDPDRKTFANQRRSQYGARTRRQLRLS